MELKDPSDYTGLEYSIKNQIDHDQIEWFPDNGPKEEGGEIEELMGSLEEKMGKMSEDVTVFIDNYSTVVSLNNSKILKITEDFKKKVADMNEPAPLEI